MTLKIKRGKKFNAICLLCFFIIIQPFIDILPLYERNKYQLLGFTIPTIVRCLFILLFLVFMIKKIKKENIKYAIIYLSLLMVYVIIHHFVISGEMLLPDNYVYSFTQELFYIIRMLFPLVIIVFTKDNEITYDDFIETILLSLIIISFIIIVGNTLCLSYRSYGTGYTAISWIHWFTSNLSNYTYDELTSKGWFYMANQVSGIMVMLLPFSIYDMIMNNRKFSMLVTLLSILGMIMLGTRTAVYGWLVIVIMIITIYEYLKRVVKIKGLIGKRIYPLLIILSIGLVFLAVSPIKKRNYEYHIDDIKQYDLRPNIDSDKEEVYNYIEHVYHALLIHDTYIIDVYNYKYDSEFWYNVFDLVIKNGPIDNRVNQVLIEKRIKELNGNKLRYKLFGYSFSRMRNAGLYSEHDIIVQMFTMGILGLLLLIGPYIVIFVYFVFKMVMDAEKEINFLNLVFVMAFGMIISVSIITSHIFDELFVTTYLSFICGYFVNRITKEVKNEKC